VFVSHRNDFLVRNISVTSHILTSLTRKRVYVQKRARFCSFARLSFLFPQPVLSLRQTMRDSWFVTIQNS